MSYKIKYYAVSHKGLHRKNNQDNYICENKYLINPNRETGEVISGEITSGFESAFGVFDGIGGEEKGEVAAEIAAKTVRDYWGWKDNEDELVKVLNKANTEICRYMAEEEIPAMGTTAALIRFRKYSIDIGNLGDSKIYGLSAGFLNQLSVDHVIKLKSRGKPPLYQYLGIKEDDMVLEPYIKSFHYNENEIYLICSDGLTDMVSENEIEDILNNIDEKEAANELLSRALENGGKDNITFILFYLKRERTMSGKINISELWPDWEIEKVIGKGSFGTVYRAVNRKELTNNTCAVKVISIPLNETETDNLFYEGISESDARTYYREVVEDFVSEIQMMELLKDCPNVVKIIDYKVVEKKESVGWDIYVRMELLTPLNAYLSGKKLTEEEVLKIGSDLCNVLEVCSEHNIIHRDIKPENVFVNEAGEFKLGDFGIAKKLEDASASLSQKGTFNYMAPEIINSIDYDSRVDIYSLGILLYRMLNDNRLPFVDTEKQLLSPNDRKTALERRMKGEKLPAPKSASPKVSEIVLKACAYEPNQRYKTAGDLRKDLEEVMKPEVEEAPVLAQNVAVPNKSGNTFNTASIILAFASIIVIGICACFMAYQMGINSSKEQKQELVSESSVISEETSIESSADATPSIETAAPEYDEKKSARYLEGVAELKNKNYEKAKAIFEEVGDYSDAKDLVTECDYQKALYVLQSGDYSGAKILFTDLGDYRESLANVKLCDYNKALSTMKLKNFEDAKAQFIELGSFKDAEYMSGLCDFEQGCDLLRQGFFSEAALYLFRVVSDEKWLNEYAKSYGGGQIATDESVDYNGSRVPASKRVRYWNNGNCGIIIDYVDDDDNPDLYTFRALKEDSEDGYGFFTYDASGYCVDAWVFDN